MVVHQSFRLIFKELNLRTLHGSMLLAQWTTEPQTLSLSWLTSPNDQATDLDTEWKIRSDIRTGLQNSTQLQLRFLTLLSNQSMLLLQTHRYHCCWDNHLMMVDYQSMIMNYGQMELKPVTIIWQKVFQQLWIYLHQELSSHSNLLLKTKLEDQNLAILWQLPWVLCRVNH